MKHVWKMLMAALLSLVLLLAVTGAMADETAVYGVCTANGVNVRKTAGTGGALWFQVDKGHVAQILNETTVGGDVWYRVNTGHPTPNGRTYIGYILSDYFRVMTEEETQAYLAGQVVPDPDVTAVPEATFLPSVDDALDKPGFGTEVTGAYGEITADAVNFRSTAEKAANNVITQLNEGDVVEILTVPDQIGTKYWYRVRYNGQVGYIQSNFVRMITAGATAEPELPDLEEDDVYVTATGIITADDVNFRLGAGTNYNTLGKLKIDTVVELLSIPSVIDSTHWYKIRYNNQEGYVQAPFIRVLTLDESDLPNVERYGYARLLEDAVNLRDSAGGETVVQWTGKGTMLRITGEIVDGGVYQWYPVYYAARNTIYYVRADMVEVVMVENGSIVTPTPAAPSAYGYVITTAKGVNLRIKPAGESIAQLPKGLVVACVGPAMSPAESKTSYTWYMVKYEGMTGYLRGDCVRVCTADGGDVVATPTPTAMPTDGSYVYGYISLVKDKVYLREKPLGNARTQLPVGLILPMIGPGYEPGEYGSYGWYHVRTADGLVGYIRSDCAVVSSNEGEVVATPTPTAKPTDQPVSGAYARTLKSSNFRDEAGYNGKVKAVIPAGTVVEVLTIPADKVNGWYKVKYNGNTGYVLASLLVMVSDGTEATPAPSVSAYGYVMISDDKVNFRNEPNGKTIYKQLEKGTVWPMTGNATTKNGVTWYPIEVNGQKGYVHGDYSFKLSASQQDSYLAGNGVPQETPAPEVEMSTYLITTADKVYLRETYSQDSSALYQVRTGTVMLFNAYKEVGTVTWYNVVYDNREVWIHGNYIKIMTVAEYQQWVAENPESAPDVTANLGYMKLIKDNVYIRNAANGSTIIDQLKKGTVMRYYSEKIAGGAYEWYRVLTPDGEFGYVRADMVELCDQYGDALPTPTPNLGDVSSAPNSQQETDYTNLRIGASGYRVLNLVNELINQGYYKGAPTSNFTSEVEAAVKAFQAANGLSADGVAGDSTQHRLFGTKPIGYGDTSNLDFAIYPVEKIDWYTGGIQEMIPRGSKFKIYDVKTGIVWWAYRQAGSRHADIETLTAADSARLCQIYGTKNLQEVVDKNMWQRRPCLVTIGTRTFAASLDGMQHGDDTISGNNMDGQVCLHFTNSEGHASQAVSSSHAEAITYAYNHCPAGKK